MKVVRYKLSWSTEQGDFIFVVDTRLAVPGPVGMPSYRLVHPYTLSLPPKSRTNPDPLLNTRKHFVDRLNGSPFSLST